MTMLFSLVLSLCAWTVSTQGFSLPSDQGVASCHLPTGEPALCTPFDSCRPIKALVGNLRQPLPGDVSLYLRDSFFCPTEDPDSLDVCCPISGIVPPTNVVPSVEPKDSCGLQDPELEGACADIFDCSPFLQLLTNLQRPLPPEVPGLMRSGLLCGIDRDANGKLRPKICCPKAALPTTEPSTKPPRAINKFEGHPNRKALADSAACGKVPSAQNRIVGGQAADIGQYPWLANLGYALASEPNNVQFKCGGALVGDRYVITAAHCVTNLPGGFELVRVRLGEHDLTKDPDCKPVAGSSVEPDCSFVQDFDVNPSLIIPHESYNSPNPFQNDVALIKLDRPAEWNDYVVPICLPFDDDEDEQYLINPKRLRTEVAGWGATNERGRDPATVLQWLGVNVTDPDACKDIYKTRGGVLSPLQQMCAGGEKGKDSCVGDSGSALMKETEDIPTRWKIIGVVSFGPRLCGTEGVPGVYTRLRFYLPWILDNVETT